MGGMVAQHLYAKAPERVGGLVLCGTTSSAGTSYQQATVQLRELVRTQGSGALGAALGLGVFGADYRRTHAAQVEEFVADVAACDEAVLIATLNAITQFDLTDRLVRVTVPCAVVVGDGDPFVEDCRLLASSISGASLSVPEGVGHMEPIESPGEVAAAIEEVVERSERSGAGDESRHYHTFQCPPWMDAHHVFHGEIERAVLAEELGYDSVWVPEQHFFDYCLCGDALQMAAFIAAQTNRVRIGTAVVNLTFTHPLRFAERVAMLDILSGGRVDIGVGRGYQWPQYPVMGVDMETTRERFDESLDIVLSAWKPNEFEHHGQYYDIPPVRLWPVPERQPEDVLLHAASSPTSVDNAISRGIPAIFSSFIPIETEAAAFAEDLSKVEAAGGDIAKTRQRATVMRYSSWPKIARRPGRSLANRSNGTSPGSPRSPFRQTGNSLVPMSCTIGRRSPQRCPI